MAYYRNHGSDINQILHSDKDQQMLFMGGLNTRETNPRWRMAAILKNRKSAISPSLTDRHKIWHGDAYWLSLSDR